MNPFAKLVLLNDVLAIVRSAGALIQAGEPVLPELESVALEVPGVLANLSYASAMQFVNDIKNAWADTVRAYSGSSVQLADFVAAVRKLIADAKGA